MEEHKYIRLEIKEDGNLIETPTNNDSWLNQYYSGSGTLRGTICLPEEKNLAINKLFQKVLKEVVLKISKLQEVQNMIMKKSLKYPL